MGVVEGGVGGKRWDMQRPGGEHGRGTRSSVTSSRVTEGSESGSDPVSSISWENNIGYPRGQDTGGRGGRQRREEAPAGGHKR